MDSSVFQWLHALIISFFLTIWFSNSFLSSATQIFYADHCNSFVPESTLNKFEPALSSFALFHTGYYTGGDEILYHIPSEDSYSLTFRAQNAYKTDKDGVFAIEGHLLLRGRNSQYYERDVVYMELAESESATHESAVCRRRSSVKFRLHGFWSESSGDLCMVGGGVAYSEQGRLLNLGAVLKLGNLKNSSSITTLVNGSLESSSSINDLNYFEPISILILPRMSYEYTLVSKALSNDFSSGIDVKKSLPLSSLHRSSFCSVFSSAASEFSLKYSHNCSFPNIGSPFGAAAVGDVPLIVSLKQLQCSEREKRVRVLIEYPHSGLVDLNKTLVAEGFWDDRMNQLCVVGCRFLNTAESLADAYVGDCTTRLSLSFPSIWSITGASTIVGEIWSEGAVNEAGYFNKILFRDSGNSFLMVPEMKYEYTEIDRARQLCWPKKKPQNNKGKRYPNGYSHDMRFSFRLRRPSAYSSWGHATPLSVGDQLYQQYLNPRTSLSSSNSKALGEKHYGGDGLVNISYKLAIRVPSGATFGGQVYSLDISRSSDEVEISAEGIYDSETGQLCMVGCRNISKMDWEIVIALISNTLACLFVGLQLLHVKKHPEVLPSISLVMVLLLSLNHLIPLLLNIETSFLKDPQGAHVLLSRGGWLEVNGVLVRIITMVAFLLKVRLLQLTWSAKLADKADRRGLWLAEMWTLLSSFSLYAAGAFIFYNFHRMEHNYYPQPQLWEDLKLYAGFVLDGFLVPQIIFNIIRNSHDNALACSFYMGATTLRVLPHVYNLFYTNANYFSDTCITIVSLLGLLFAAIIFLQQLFGDRGNDTRKFIDDQEYQKVPADSETRLV